MTLQSRDLVLTGAEVLSASSRNRRGQGVTGPRPLSPQLDATMLSRLLKEHQAKQNERKELQGKANIGSAVFSPAAA